MLKAVIKKQLPGFNLDVEFEAGNEVLALLGASGCGKSMTLKCIAGIEKPDSGYIELDGKVLFDSRKRIDLPPQKRRVGYLFQNYALLP
jgi:molybdate transport system ATP-binding protein